MGFYQVFTGFKAFNGGLKLNIRLGVIGVLRYIVYSSYNWKP